RIGGAKTQANPANLPPAVWANAEQPARDGQQAFDRNDFEAAARSWDLAAGRFAYDPTPLKGVNAAREAFEALRKKPICAGLEREAPEEYREVQALVDAAGRASSDPARAAALYEEARRELHLTALPRLKAHALDAGGAAREV